ncbi:MAG: metal-sensing transcriptional repressor [Bacilli bacterium]|nr:metal-sensing transcriptional repressor [Bacilli bacterium]
MKADHNKIKHQIAIVKGQLDGILAMIDRDEYCIDVSNQILAAISGLKKANNEVVTAHLESCVRNAKNQDDLDQKMAEVSQILKRMSN